MAALLYRRYAFRATTNGDGRWLTADRSRTSADLTQAIYDQHQEVLEFIIGNAPLRPIPSPIVTHRASPSVTIVVYHRLSPPHNESVENGSCLGYSGAYFART